MSLFPYIFWLVHVGPLKIESVLNFSDKWLFSFNKAFVQMTGRLYIEDLSSV